MHMGFPLTDQFLEDYKTAAAEGATVELKLRLLADKIPALQEFAHKRKLENVEAAVTRHFATDLSDANKETLRLCRELRNKILHCDFRVARDRLEELGVPRPHGSVKKVDVSGLSRAQIAERLTKATADIKDSYEFVADTQTTDPGSVFGWLYEMGQAGDFHYAVAEFEKASTILDRLANLRA